MLKIPKRKIIVRAHYRKIKGKRVKVKAHTRMIEPKKSNWIQDWNKTAENFDKQRNKRKIKNIPLESSLYYKAKQEHDKRNKRAKAKDESSTSKIVYPTWNKKWSKNPNQSDIQGIDTKKLNAKTSKEAYYFLKSVEPKLINTNPNGKRTFIHLKGKGNQAQKKKKLQDLINIRYKNISIRPRRKKNTSDFIIKIRR